MDDYSVQLASTFADIISKYTINWVENKIAQAREKRDIKEQQNAYEEIINSLLQKNMELERVAREYKILYERVTISDEDIEYLQKTIKSALELLFSFAPDMKKQEENINLLIELLNKDTLKTMQLLGFNYKEAIGQPLTEVCANAIKRKLSGANKQSHKKGK